MIYNGILNNKYEIGKYIGDNNVFQIYEATDVENEGRVIVKAIRPELAMNKKIINKFRSQAEYAKKFSEPDIVTILDFGCDNNVNYVVEDCADGLMLSDYLKKNGNLDPKEAAKIVLKLAKCLKKVHPIGFIHGGINEQNVLIFPDNSVKLTDFGFGAINPLPEDYDISVREFITDEEKELLENGNSIDWTLYFSNEELNKFPVDDRTDIYSLGVIFYKMITGNLPYEAENAEKLSLLQSTSKPVSPRKLNNDVSKELEDIIYTSLSKNAGDRYSNIDNFIVELEYYINDSGLLKLVKNPLAVRKQKEKKKKELSQTQKRKKKAKLNSFLLNCLVVLVGATLLCLFVYGVFNVGKTIYENNFVVSTVKVPSIVGKKADDAKEILKDRQLIYREISTAYNPTVKAGYVISQMPLDGEKVNEDTLVDVVVSLGAFIIDVPDCIGKDISVAQLELISNPYIVVGKYTYVESNEPKDVIVSQSIPAGDYSLDGNEVTITFEISQGPNTDIVEIPKLVGYTLTNAQQFANIRKVKIGRIYYEYSDTVKKDVVISQSIAAGATVSADTKLDITVSLGKKVYETKTVVIDVPVKFNVEDDDTVEVVVKILQVVGNKSEFVDIINTLYPVYNNQVEIDLTNAGTETYYFYINGTFVTNKTVVFN